MKKRCLLLLAVLIPFTTFVQSVGIGTITHAPKLRAKASNPFKNDI